MESLSNVKITQTNWRSLYIYTIYRLLLVSIFIFSSIYPGKLFVETQDTQLYKIVVYIYSFVTFISLLTTYMHRPKWSIQIIFYVICDILLITTIMHASGGSTTGLGMLLIVSIVSGGILMPGKIAFLFASIASLSILFEQIFSEITQTVTYVSYTQSGILGICFFATATLAHVLSQKIRSTEALAQQQGFALEKAEQLTVHILQQMHSGILVVDSEEVIQVVNEAARRLLPISVERGQSLKEKFPILVGYFLAWKKNHNKQPPLFQLNKTGPNLAVEFSVLTHGKNPLFLITVNDGALMTQKAQQIKLASLGRLTASIAHEIRNPLGAISHAAQLLEEAQYLEEGDKRLIEIIQEHSKNMNTLIKNILQLSKRTPSAPKIFLLSTWLQNYLEKNIYIQMKDAEIDIDINPKNIYICMDDEQLSQILSNLCDNGLHYSIEKTGRSTLHLKAGIDTVSKQAYLDIMDDGPGIPEKNRQYVFEPFFTTKREGTGLGLYIAKELCDVNQARLDYISSYFPGCCFRITFPSSKQELF